MALGPAALILGGIGTAISAVGAVNSADAAGKAAAYQAQVARNNSTIANQNASAASQAGAQKAQNVGLQGRAALARATAGIAASGVDVNSGSAVDVESTDREMNQLNTEQDLHNTALQVYGYRSQSVNFQAQAGLDQATADQAPLAGALAAGSDLLQGASSLGTKWSQMQTAGAI